MTKSYKKLCPNCCSQSTKKDGRRRGRQSYKCVNCKYVRISKKRLKKQLLPEQIYKQYAIHKQTYSELSTTFGISKKSVQVKLDSFVIPKADCITPRSIILIIDTTYFGRDFGIMIFIDSGTNKPIHYQTVQYETNDAYKHGVRYLQEQGRHIQAIVSDGRRGLLGGFNDIPTQMCHFHQAQIVRRNITKNPKLQENKELKHIVDWLPRTDKETFTGDLERWYEKNKSFINEKTLSSTGKRAYKHKKTRTAYYSLKRNLPYLFVYLDYLHLLDIPNTTNGAEGFFSHFKYKVTLHRGLALKRRLKLIQYLLLSLTK